jgi:hypothetical protein
MIASNHVSERHARQTRERIFPDERHTADVVDLLARRFTPGGRVSQDLDQTKAGVAGGV